MKHLIAVLLGGLCFAQVPETVAKLRVDPDRYGSGPVLMLQNRATKPINAVAVWNLESADKEPGSVSWDGAIQPGGEMDISMLQGPVDLSKRTLAGVAFTDGTFLGWFTQEWVDNMWAQKRGFAKEWQHWRNVINDLDTRETPGRAVRAWIAAARAQDVPQTRVHFGSTDYELAGMDAIKSEIRQKAEMLDASMRDDKQAWKDLKEWAKARADLVETSARKVSK